MEVLMTEQTSRLSRTRRRTRHTARLLRRTNARCLTNRDRSGALYDPHLAEHSWRVLFIALSALIIAAVGARTMGYYRLVSTQTHIFDHTASAAWCWYLLVSSEKQYTSVLVDPEMTPRRTSPACGTRVLHPQPVKLASAANRGPERC